MIQTGGKQYRVEEGTTLDVEKINADGDEVTFTPLLLVDGDRVIAKPAELSGASVSARIVGATKGPKITGFTYKNKTNQRKRWGHRQPLATIEITGIKA